MSSYDQAAKDAETQQQRAKGVEAFLSADERKQMQRYLSFPEEFPQKFGAWIKDYMELNGSFTRGQVQGLSLFTSRVDAVGTSETRGTDTYADLATVGPQLTGLGDGTWLIFFGCTVNCVANTFTSAMSIQVNDVAATDSDCFTQGYTVSEGAAVESLTVSGMRAVLKVLAEGNNNTITTKYKANTSTSFSNRWIVALRVGS